MALTIPRIAFPKPGEPGARRSRGLWLAGSSLVVLLLAYNSCTTYVRPGEAGVKQIRFGIAKGIEPRVYGVGLHYVGFGEMIHRFPTRVQVLELTSSRHCCSICLRADSASRPRRSSASESQRAIPGRRTSKSDSRCCATAASEYFFGTM